MSDDDLTLIRGAVQGGPVGGWDRFGMARDLLAEVDRLRQPAAERACTRTCGWTGTKTLPQGICPRCGAGTVELVEQPAAPPAADRLREQIEALDWALDIIAMYDSRLCELGDPPELVFSASQIRARRKAGEALIKLRQLNNVGGLREKILEGVLEVIHWGTPSPRAPVMQNHMTEISRLVDAKVLPIITAHLAERERLAWNGALQAIEGQVREAAQDHWLLEALEALRK